MTDSDREGEESYTITVLEWEDPAAAVPEWVDPEKVEAEPGIVQAVGILLKEDERYIILVRDLEAEGDVHSPATYIKSTVRRRRDIRFQWENGEAEWQRERLEVIMAHVTLKQADGEGDETPI